MGTCTFCNKSKISETTRYEIYVPQLNITNKNIPMTKLSTRVKTNKKSLNRLSTEKIIKSKCNNMNNSMIIKSNDCENILNIKRNITTKNNIPMTLEIISNKNQRKIKELNTDIDLKKKTTLKKYKTIIKLKSNLTNTNDVKLEEEKNIHYEFSESNLSFQEENNLSKIFSNHYLFNRISKNSLTYLISELKEFEIDEKTSIFFKGDEGSCIFIIKKGKVEINNNNNQKFYLNEGNIFGELAILNYNIIRNYDAFSFTNLNFYSIDFNSFENISKEILKKNDFNCIIFNGFDLETINNLHYLTNHILFKKNQIINDLNYLFEIISGELILIDDKNNQIDNYTNGDYFHFKNCFEDNQKEDYNNIFYYNNKYTLIAKEDTSCIIFPAIAFIEIFGTDFKKKIMFNFLKYSLSKEKIIDYAINNNYETIFPEFKFKEYKRGEYLYDIKKERKKNRYKKICIILSGVAVKKTGTKKFNKNIFVNPGDIIGTEFFFGNSPLNILVNTNHLFTFECYYETLLENIVINNSSLKEIISNIKKIYLFKDLIGFDLFKICKCLKKEYYNKNDKIIQKGKKVEKVYFIIKGKVKFIVDNHTYKEYYEGNSFGEIFLLNEKNAQSEIICSSEKLILYSLKKEDFYNLIANEKFNNLIKRKLCLEDIEIFPKNLYYISTLHNGKQSKIYLVHNKIFLYIIKAFYVDYQKKKNPNNILSKCIINEKKSSKRLDHPFINSYVKTLRNNNWCFFLSEYINGISMSEYIEMNKPFKNLNLIKFYSGLLFIILENLKYRGIIHRDIKPQNIFLKENGYLKLIDFSSSKRIKKNKTKSIVGTPFYIAPEILNGNTYSYSCDYWSVGILLYYLYFGIFPFGNSSKKIDSIYKEILNKNIDYYENECKDNLIIKNFLQLILERNEKKRLCSLNKIIECDFYKDFSFKLLLKEKMEPPFLPQVVKIDEKNLLHNLSNPFLNFIQNEKIESDRKNSILKFHKDTLRNEDNNQNYDNCYKGKNWFDDF